jgi:hypothetical protein
MEDWMRVKMKRNDVDCHFCDRMAVMMFWERATMKRIQSVKWMQKKWRWQRANLLPCRRIN